MGRIIVGMDQSPGAGAALQWAHREAVLRHWKVTAVLAWDLQNPSGGPDRALLPERSHEESACRTLEAVVVEAVGPDAAREIDRRALYGLPAPTLVDESARADLLVVGARGLGGFDSLLLGSISDQCLAHAICPVAVVHASERRRPHVPERIVVGIDGSATAQRALRWALTAARARDAQVLVVHCWAPAIIGGALVPEPVDTTSMRQAAENLLDTALDGADTEGLRSVDRVLLHGGAAGALLETARGADLVVVGSRGLGGFESLLVGSVSHQVARHAGCPVVVLPPKCDFGP